MINVDKEEGLAIVGELTAIARAIRRECPNLERIPSGSRSPRRPPKKRKEVDEQQILRGLGEIARAISSDRPPCVRTTRRLIREAGLPARKVIPVGWISTRKAVEAWVNRCLETRNLQKK